MPFVAPDTDLEVDAVGFEAPEDDLLAAQDTGQGRLSSHTSALGRGFGRAILGATEQLGQLGQRLDPRKIGSWAAQKVTGASDEEIKAAESKLSFLPDINLLSPLSKPLEKGSKAATEYIEKKLPVNPAYQNEWGGKIAGAVGQMAGMVLPAIASGGTSLGVNAARALPLVQGGLLGMKSGYEEADRQGITDTSQRDALALAYGAAEASVERLGGLGSKEFTQRLLGEVTKKGGETFLQKLLGATAGRAVGTALQEGIEEPITGELQDIAANVFGGENAPSFNLLDPEVLARRGEEFALGSIAGAPLGAIDAYVSRDKPQSTEAVPTPLPTPWQAPMEDLIAGAEEFGGTEGDVLQDLTVRPKPAPEPVAPLQGTPQDLAAAIDADEITGLTSAPPQAPLEFLSPEQEAFLQSPQGQQALVEDLKAREQSAVESIPTEPVAIEQESLELPPVESGINPDSTQSATLPQTPPKDAPQSVGEGKEQASSPNPLDQLQKAQSLLFEYERVVPQGKRNPKIHKGLQDDVAKLQKAKVPVTMPDGKVKKAPAFVDTPEGVQPNMAPAASVAAAQAIKQAEKIQLTEAKPKSVTKAAALKPSAAPKKTTTIEKPKAKKADVKPSTKATPTPTTGNLGTAVQESPKIPDSNVGAQQARGSGDTAQPETKVETSPEEQFKSELPSKWSSADKEHAWRMVSGGDTKDLPPLGTKLGPATRAWDKVRPKERATEERAEEAKTLKEKRADEKAQVKEEKAVAKEKAKIEAQKNLQEMGEEGLKKWADDVVKEGNVNTGLNPRLLAAHAIRSADWIKTHGEKFVEWSKAMVKEFGAGIQRHLQRIWKAAKEALAEGAMKWLEKTGGIKFLQSTETTGGGSVTSQALSDLVKGSRGTGKEALEIISQGGGEFSELAKELLAIANPEDLTVSIGRKPASKDAPQRSVYYPDKHKIGMAWGREGDVKTAIHEIVHALTSRKLERELGTDLESGETYRKTLEAALEKESTPQSVKDLIKIYFSAVEKMGLEKEIFGEGGNRPDVAVEKGAPYGLGNLDEFMAESMSNPEFQAELNKIEGAGGKTLWKSFVEAIAKILGLDVKRTSMLEDALKTTKEVVKLPEAKKFSEGEKQSPPPLPKVNTSKSSLQSTEAQKRDLTPVPQEKKWWQKVGDKAAKVYEDYGKPLLHVADSIHQNIGNAFRVFQNEENLVAKDAQKRTEQAFRGLKRVSRNKEDADTLWSLVDKKDGREEAIALMRKHGATDKEIEGFKSLFGPEGSFQHFLKERQAAGIKVGEIGQRGEDYFPRKIRADRIKEFQQWLADNKLKHDIDPVVSEMFAQRKADAIDSAKKAASSAAAIKEEGRIRGDNKMIHRGEIAMKNAEADRQAAEKMKIEDLTEQERVDMQARAMRQVFLGRGVGASNKTRRIKELDKSLAGFYERPHEALRRYITDQSRGVPLARNFGPRAYEIFSEQTELKDSAPKFTDSELMDVNTPFGKIVHDLKMEGKLSVEQLDTLRKLTQGLLGHAPSSSIIKWMRDLNMPLVLANPMAAIRQVPSELALSGGRYGWVNSMRTLSRGLLKGWSKVGLIDVEKDLGISPSYEIAHRGDAMHWVSTILAKISGFKGADMAMANLLANASMNHLKGLSPQARIKALSKWKSGLDGIDKDAALEQVSKDIAEGNFLTENAKKVAFYNLTEDRPTGLASMPVGFLTAKGIGQLPYLLRGWGLFNFSRHRQNIWNGLKSSDPKVRQQSVANGIYLLSLMVTAGAAGDDVVDWLLGKPVDFSDRVKDNLAKTVMGSSYTAEKLFGDRPDLKSTLGSYLNTPTVDAANAIWKNAVTAVKDDEKGFLELMGQDKAALRMIPLGLGTIGRSRFMGGSGEDAANAIDRDLPSIIERLNKEATKLRDIPEEKRKLNRFSQLRHENLTQFSKLKSYYVKKAKAAATAGDYQESEALMSTLERLASQPSLWRARAASLPKERGA